MTLKAAEGMPCRGHRLRQVHPDLYRLPDHLPFAIFMGLKAINTLKKKQEEEAAAPAGPTKDQELLTEIRDLLKSQQGK